MSKNTNVAAILASNTSVAVQSSHTTVTLPKDESVTPTESIRSVIRAGIFAGHTTAMIAARVQELAPNSAAAKKSAKHIAWYKATMKKDGELVGIQTC